MMPATAPAKAGSGAVFASKNLKAVSFLGTGGIEIADPAALMDARVWVKQYAADGHLESPSPDIFKGDYALAANPGWSTMTYPARVKSRPQGCVGCIRSCRARNSDGVGNESHCMDVWHFLFFGTAGPEANMRAMDLSQRYGLNTFALLGATQWIKKLYTENILGPGKEINSNLPFETMGKSDEFGVALLDSIINQTDIGADLALGVWQCAEKWGRLEQDKNAGWLPSDVWGYTHHYDGRTEAEWGYGSLMGERDINEHDFNWVTYWSPTYWATFGNEPLVTAERMAEIIAGKTTPYNDPMMIDYSDEGIYSESMAKLVAWHRHYTRYYKQSLGFCDWAWADFINPYGPDNEGATGEGEPKFFNAVTGKNQSFEEGIELGRKIWNLDRAVWILQGRNREMEVFSGYMYDIGSTDTMARGYGAIDYEFPYTMTVFEDGEWKYKSVAGRKLDRQK